MLALSCGSFLPSSTPPVIQCPVPHPSSRVAARGSRRRRSPTSLQTWVRAVDLPTAVAFRGAAAPPWTSRAVVDAPGCWDRPSDSQLGRRGRRERRLGSRCLIIWTQPLEKRAERAGKRAVAPFLINARACRASRSVRFLPDAVTASLLPCDGWTCNELFHSLCEDAKRLCRCALRALHNSLAYPCSQHLSTVILVRDSSFVSQISAHADHDARRKVRVRLDFGPFGR